MEPAIDFLLEKKENKEPYNLPEGFKFVQKTNVKYNSRLAPHFLEILGESKFICYQVLEDIIFHIFNSSIIEPYVEISNDEEIELEPEKIHKWTPGMHIAYIEMGKEYNKIGIEVADALEEGFKKMLKGKNSKGEDIIHPYERKFIEEEKRLLKKENKQMMYLADRRKEIKEKIEKYREKKREEYKKRKKLLKKLRIKRKEEISKVRKKFEEVMERRKKKEEERKNKMASMQEEKSNKENKKNQKMIDFLTGEKRKIHEHNKELLRKKKLILKLREEELKKLTEPMKSPAPDYFQKDKEYIKFEHELNNTINNLLEREDIKKVFDDYKEHLKLIYNIYSKIDCNKISFYLTEGGIKEESFKQFLINFTVLGLLISSDQMTYIYNVITRMTTKQRENLSYLDFHDFEMALCYLAIFSRFADRARKILPSDIDNTNGETMEYFFKFLGLELPFEKYELEQYINDRRSMTVKNLLNLQRELRNNDVNEFKKIEMEKEEKKKKENKKKMMEIERKKKEQERLEEEKKIENASKRQNINKDYDKKSSRSLDKKSNKNSDKISNKESKSSNKSINKKK